MPVTMQQTPDFSLRCERSAQHLSVGSRTIHVARVVLNLATQGTPLVRGHFARTLLWRRLLQLLGLARFHRVTRLARSGRIDLPCGDGWTARSERKTRAGLRHARHQ